MASLLLGLFLFGSNYCVLAAAASATPAASRLACHAPPSTGDAAAHGCCDRSTAPEPTPRASYPCCIQVAPPATADVLPSDLASAGNVTPEVALAAPSAVRADRIALEGESPPTTASAVPRGRAPPIS